jgi:hypothetical protein
MCPSGWGWPGCRSLPSLPGHRRARGLVAVNTGQPGPQLLPCGAPDADHERRCSCASRTGRRARISCLDRPARRSQPGAHRHGTRHTARHTSRDGPGAIRVEFGLDQRMEPVQVLVAPWVVGPIIPQRRGLGRHAPGKGTSAWEPRARGCEAEWSSWALSVDSCCACGCLALLLSLLICKERAKAQIALAPSLPLSPVCQRVTAQQLEQICRMRPAAPCVIHGVVKGFKMESCRVQDDGRRSPPGLGS